MFKAALLKIAKNQNQLKFPSTGKWTSNLSYLYTMDYYLEIKKKKTTESQNPQLMNLKKYNVEQRKPGKKNTYRMIPSI